MLRTSMNLSERGYGLFRYALTNLLLAAIRTRRGLKWGIPAVFLCPTSTLRRSAPRSSTTAVPAGSTCWFCCRSGTPSRCSGSAPSASSGSCGAGARSVSEATDTLGHDGRLL